MDTIKDNIEQNTVIPVTNDKVFVGLVLSTFGIILDWLLAMFIDYKMQTFLLSGPIVFFIGILFSIIGYKQVKRNPELYKNHFLSTIAFIVIILGLILFILALALSYGIQHA